MKKTALIFALLFAASTAFAGEYTPNLNLYKPAPRENNWGVTVNENNWDNLDTLISEEHNADGSHKSITTNQINNTKTVEAFGATGTANDAAVISAACNSAHNITVVFTRLYNITDAVTCAKNGVSLVAEQPGTGIRQNGANKSGLIFTGTDGVVDGLTLISNETGTEVGMPDNYGAAITAWRTERLTVKNCNIQNWGGPAGAGIYFSGSKYCIAEHNIVDNCLNGINDDDVGSTMVNEYWSIGNIIRNNIVSNSRASGISIDFQQSDSTPKFSYGVRVEGNTVYGTKLYSGSYGNGIIFDTVRSGAIISNVSNTNAANGISLFHKTLMATVVGNIANQNGSSGLQSTSDSASVPGSSTISGNTFLGNNLNGMRFEQGSNQYTVSDNVVRYNQYDGIYSDSYFRTSTLRGNIVQINSRHGIHLKNSFSVKVQGNVISQNGNDGVGNNYDGIYVEREAGPNPYDYYGIEVENNVFDATSNGVEYQRYAVNFVSNAASNRNSITGNIIKGQLTGNWVDGATATKISHNDTLTTKGVYPVERHDYLTLPGGQIIFGGSGAPAISAPEGSVYFRTDGGWKSNIYTKVSGTDATGWVTEVDPVTSVTHTNSTIDVTRKGFANLNQASPTTITAFTGMQELQIVRFIAFNGNTTVQHGGGINLEWSLNTTIPDGGILTMIYAAGEWYELARNYNASTASGVYVPTLTAVANITGTPTSNQAQYMRVGNVVTVSGYLITQPTTTTTTQIGISLPIASNLTAAENCGGTAFSPAVAGQGAAIYADAANDRAHMQWVAVDTSARNMMYHFTYRVQ